MKRYLTGALLLALLATGCNQAGKEARARLENARTMYEQGELFSAKNEIDTLRAHYPKEVKVLKDALELMRLVELKEAARTIAYCDSLLPLKQEEVATLSKGFVFEKDTVYEEVGNYIWKQQTVERNVERSYIRCGVNERGEMYLASVYFGPRALGHTSIKVSTKDGPFAETARIPYDGGVNYRFQDGANVTEIVNYKKENGEAAIKFIYNNTKERIRVDYEGGKPYTIYMADADKQALAATYDLAMVLSDIETMTRAHDKSTRRKAYLEGKLADAPDENKN